MRWKIFEQIYRMSTIISCAIKSLYSCKCISIASFLIVNVCGKLTFIIIQAYHRCLTIQGNGSCRYLFTLSVAHRLWSSWLSFRFDSVLPSRLRLFSRGFPGISISATLRMFYVACLFSVSEPFQPSPSHYHLNRFHLSTSNSSSSFSDDPVGSHQLSIAPSSSWLLPIAFYLLRTLAIFAAERQSLSIYCLV